MKKFGFVSLIGETNSGKSTLINQIMGTKVSIVSHKVQTTRRKILGIYTNNISQLVFIDTPGIFKPKRELDNKMVSSAYSSANTSTLTLLLVDAQKGFTASLKTIITKLQKSAKNIILVLNKIDLVPKQKLLTLTKELNNQAEFTKIFMISALKNQGVTDLISYLESELPESEWLFNQDDISDAADNFLASEITREKIYKYLHQELPYMIAVVPESLTETPAAIIIKQIIYVTSLAHKKIVLGRAGTTIKRIGSESRIELTDILAKKVHLYLFVKVKPNLFEEVNNYSALGLI